MRRTGVIVIIASMMAVAVPLVSQAEPVDRLQPPSTRSVPGGQAAEQEPQGAASAPAASRPGAPAVPDIGWNLSVTQHSMQVAGRTLRYTATTGLMPISNDEGKLQAEMFFVAYTRDSSRSQNRPILFAFNGGPGAASIWLHLAALGPRRVVLGEGGTSLPARLRLVDNEYTWLDFADLVFVDPVGTGFSRAVPGIDAKRFYTIKADAEITGQFVRRYVTRYERWLSPKFIAGESYGTTRAVALAGHLQNDVGMLVDGLVLISSALDFQTLMFEESNDLPYILFLPSYTATAWYHGRLPAALQNESMEKVLAQAQRWANVEYRLALALGDALDESRRERVIEQYAYYTGLSRDFIRTNNLRVRNTRFIHEVLRAQGRVVGILDGRVTGLPAGRESFVTDPSLFVTLGPLVATLYDYVRSDLRYETDRQYEFLNSDVSSQWSWGSAAEGFPSVVATLRQAMSANTRLRVHMACGYFDLDTSYMSQRYTAEHLLLDESIKDHLQVTTYYGGHQLYTFVPALESLTENIRTFIQAGR